MKRITIFTIAFIMLVIGVEVWLATMGTGWVRIFPIATAVAGVGGIGFIVRTCIKEGWK